jgi:DNA-binding response OmpR family regulator
MHAGHIDRGKRILIVDDDASITRTIQFVLTREGHQIEVAADSNTALNLYDARVYDLVIVDFVMPGLDGLELARLIRTWNPAQPILLLTGNLKDMVRSGGSLDSFTKVLEKPFSGDNLRAAVTAVLRAA